MLLLYKMILMSLRIPPLGDQPTIIVFDSPQELQAETGQSLCHGLFDPKKNTILATADSVAHEIGHYLDFKSGQFRIVSSHFSSEEKISARLRNEIVAILFAYAKVGEGGTSLSYEWQFVKWLMFMRANVNRFGPHTDISLNNLKLEQIQEIADWLTNHEHPWFARLKFFFGSYLTDEDAHQTYGFLTHGR